MNIPSWISDNLAVAALTAHSSTTTPITLVLTTPNITFCQSEGPTFTCTPTDLLAYLTRPLNNPDPLPLPAETNVSAVIPSVAPVTEDISSNSDNIPLADILADIQDASLTPVPELTLVPGTPAVQTTNLLERLSRETRRRAANHRLQLHLAYQLGSLQHEYPVQFRNQLDISIPVARTRRRLTIAVNRTYQLVQLVGLPRIYGTTRLTFGYLKRMKNDDFDIVLMPALQAYLWPPCDSEDLVFSEGAYVSTGSDESHDSEAS